MTSITAKLGEVADVVRGVTYSADDVSDGPRDGYLPILRAGNIGEELNIGNDLVWVPANLIRAAQKVRQNDLVMCTSSGSAEVVGKLAKAPQDWDGSFGAFCAVVRSRDGKSYPAYLAHFLRSPSFKLWTKKSLGANIKNIRKSELEEFEVPSPPIIEQRRIAAILDKADSIQKKRGEAIKLVEDSIRSAFLQLLGNTSAVRVAIEELLPATPNAIRTGPFGSQLLHSEFTDCGIPVLGIDNVVTNRFRWAERRYVSSDKYKELRRYRVFPGDVMVTIMGTTGRVCIAPSDLPESISTKHLCTITPDRQRLLPEFLWASLLCDPLVRAQAAREGKGAIMEGWNMGIVRGLMIILPSIAHQEHFAAFVRKAEGLRIRLLAAEAESSQLFGSLAQRAFSGQL